MDPSLYSNNLTVLRHLMIYGPQQIREVGVCINKLIKDLENVGNLSDSTRSIIREYKQNLNKGNRQYREYQNHCEEVFKSNASIQTQVRQLATPFEELREAMSKFYNNLYNFITDLDLTIQDDHIVFPDAIDAIAAMEAREAGEASEASHESIEAGEASESSQESIEAGEACELSHQNEGIQIAEEPDNYCLANNKLIWELNIPFQTLLPVSSYEISTFSNGFFSISPQLQLQYRTTTTGCNTLFFGVKCDLSVDFSNLSKFNHQNSHVASARILNTMGKIYHTPSSAETTLSVGQIFQVKNTEIGTFVNVGVGQIQNISFELECSGPSAMFSFNQNSYLMFKPSISYEFFPFTSKTNELIESSSNSGTILTKQNNSLDSISQENYENLVSQNNQLASTTLDKSLNNLLNLLESAETFETTIKSGDFEYNSNPSIKCLTNDCIKIDKSQRIRQEACIDTSLPIISQTHTNELYKTGLSSIIAIVLGVLIYHNKNKIQEFFHSFTKTKNDT